MRSLERALELMAVLRRNRGPMRLTEISREADLHLATTQRILNVLVRYDYVHQEGLGYTVGVTSLLNAHAFLVTNTLGLVSSPVLQELAVSTGLTASLSVRVGLSQVMLVRIEGSRPLRYQLPVGEQLPLHRGGARVLAAALQPDELDEILDSLGEIQFASGETLTEEEFRQTLKQIRDQGFAYGQSQRELGAASIAVPVFGRDGSVVASMQVSGLVGDFEKSSIDRYVAELQRASDSITRRIP